MEQRLCSGRVSVRRLSRPSGRCCGFAAVGPAARRYRSIATRPAVNSSRATARRTAANAGSATSADVRNQRRQSKYIYFFGGGAIEVPKAPRGWVLILDLKMAICGAFLVQFFCSSAKTLRGRKDTLAQVYFYWRRQSPPLPHGIDATARNSTQNYT